MNLTRRSLLAMLAGAALDPDLLLWRPGRKLISLPPAPKATFLRVNIEYLTHSTLRYNLEILNQYGKRLSVHECSRRTGLLQRTPLPLFPCDPSPPLPDVVGLRLWPREIHS